MRGRSAKTETDPGEWPDAVLKDAAMRNRFVDFWGRLQLALRHFDIVMEFYSPEDVGVLADWLDENNFPVEADEIRQCCKKGLDLGDSTLHIIVNPPTDPGKMVFCDVRKDGLGFMGGHYIDIDQGSQSIQIVARGTNDLR